MQALIFLQAPTSFLLSELIVGVVGDATTTNLHVIFTEVPLFGDLVVKTQFPGCFIAQHASTHFPASTNFIFAQ